MLPWVLDVLRHRSVLAKSKRLWESGRTDASLGTGRTEASLGTGKVEASSGEKTGRTMYASLEDDGIEPGLPRWVQDVLRHRLVPAKSEASVGTGISNRCLSPPGLVCFVRRHLLELVGPTCFRRNRSSRCIAWDRPHECVCWSTGNYLAG